MVQEVETALEHLLANRVVELDEDRSAAMAEKKNPRSSTGGQREVDASLNALEKYYAGDAGRFESFSPSW